MAEHFHHPCGYCNGKGMQSGPLGLLRSVCPKCDGRGYIELANVINGPFVTKLDSNPDRILQGAIGQLQSVIVIGHTIEGHEYFASSIADGPNALWILQRTAYNLLRVVDKDADE